jgi:hypothetical protein
MAIANNKKAESDRAFMYWLKTQPWLPHYVKKGWYVAPGGEERQDCELVSMGAIKTDTMLWPRSWQFDKGGLK